MAKKVDSGEIILQKKINIEKNDDIVTLHSKVLSVYYKFVVIFFSNFPNLLANKKKQNNKLSTYNKKRYPHDGKIQWNKKGKDIINLIRALKKPWPGAFTLQNKKILFIWEATFEKIKIKKQNIGKFFKSKKSFYYNCKDGKILIKAYSMKKINPYLQKTYL